MNAISADGPPTSSASRYARAASSGRSASSCSSAISNHSSALRSEDAAGAVKSANDLTNELLTSNARNLRQANAKVRRETERGVFDIEAVRTANAELIATIEESLQIADEGKARRGAAETDLERMEADLRTTLSRATALRKPD